jgi:hypothetical protein
MIETGAISSQLLLEQSKQRERLEKLEQTVAKLLEPAA